MTALTPTAPDRRPPLTEPKDRLIKASEAAQLLGLSTRAVWRLRSAGVLPAVQINAATRFRLSDVQGLMLHGTGGR